MKTENNLTNTVEKGVKDVVLNAIDELMKSSEFLSPSEYLFFQSDLCLSKPLDLLAEQILNGIETCIGVAREEDFKFQNSKFDFNVVVGVLDDLHEQVDGLLDEKNTTKQVGNQSQLTLLRPQLYFKDLIDNSCNPWVPILKHKFNAKVPLDSGLHPYEYEISNISYPTEMFIPNPAIKYKILNDTPLIWVDNVESLSIILLILELLCQDLDSLHEFAVDLEHHDFRSYYGFTCLIQISTRENDYIIDALKIRHELYLLNSSFTNPKIVKVLHGAAMDVQWLQRGFINFNARFWSLYSQFI